MIDLTTVVIPTPSPWIGVVTGIAALLITVWREGGERRRRRSDRRYLAVQLALALERFGDGCTDVAADDGYQDGRSRQLQPEPWHHVVQRLGEDAVIARSSNYGLYHDMSCRFTEILKDAAPAFEPYSIDESFLLIDGVPNPERFGREIKARVLEWTGLPCCAGIGSTRMRCFVRCRRSNHKRLLQTSLPRMSGATEPEILPRC